MVDTHRESRFDFVGFVRVEVIGQWFFMVLPANNWGVWPAALVPPTELARMRLEITGRQGTSAQ